MPAKRKSNTVHSLATYCLGATEHGTSPAFALVELLIGQPCTAVAVGNSTCECVSFNQCGAGTGVVVLEHYMFIKTLSLIHRDFDQAPILN